MLHDIDVVIGRNLRALRALRGLSLADLGAKCEDGLSAQQISKYELGENKISCSRMVEFASVMGCNLLDFFRGINVQSPST